MDQVSQDYAAVFATLYRRWLGYVVFCLACLAGGYLVLRMAWEPEYALRWLALSATAMIYPVAILRRELKHNHRPGESTLLPNLGPGNVLSLLRGVLVSALVGFLFSPWPPGWLAWVPGGLYILSDTTDFFDGYLARRSGYTTRLGESLEMSFDGFGVLVAALLIVQYGQAPIWYLLVAFARYLFVAGVWIRKALKKPVYELPPSSIRRAMAAWQMGFVAAVLLPIFSPPITWAAAALFALPFLAGFLRDWFWVSGVIRRPVKLSPGLQEALGSRVPVALRIMLPVLAAGPLLQRFQTLDRQAPFQVFVTFLEAAVILAVMCGFAGRVSAIVGLVILGINQNSAPLTVAQYLMAVDYTAIIFLGTGPYSVWKPEEMMIYRRIGERSRPKQPLGRTNEAPG